MMMTNYYYMRYICTVRFIHVIHTCDSVEGPQEIVEEQGNAEKRFLTDKSRCGSTLSQPTKARLVLACVYTRISTYTVCRYRIEEEKGRVARGGTEEEKTGKDEIEMPEVPLTSEQIDQNMTKWKPYLAYVDDLISKALIQAVSSRYR